MNFSKLTNGMRILLSREKSYYCNKPLSASLDLTYRCNLRCKMCEVWKQHGKREAEELTFDEIAGVIEQLAAMKIPTINLIGGEVLLRKDIIDIISVIKKHNIFCDLTTNGTLINEGIADSLVRQKVDHMVVSIDASDERHDKIRMAAGALEKIKQGIGLINTFKKMHHSSLPQLTINTTISALNVDAIDMMLPFAEGLQVNNLCFTYLNEVPNGIVEESNKILKGDITVENVFTSGNSSLLLKTKKQIETLRAKIEWIKSESRNTAVSVRFGLGLYQKDSCIGKGLFPIKKCYMLHNRILIDPYGRVYPCYSLLNYTYGNVKTGRLKDIWHNDKAIAIRRQLNKALLPVCHYCGCHFDRNAPPVKFLSWFMHRGH